MPTLPIRTGNLSVQLPVSLLDSAAEARLLSKSRRPGLSTRTERERNGPQGIPKRHGRMAARVTDAMQTRMATLPQHPGLGRSIAHARLARPRSARSRASCGSAWTPAGASRTSRARGSTLGHEQGELLGTHWTTVVIADDHAAMRVAIERALRTTRRAELELRMKATPAARAPCTGRSSPATGSESSPPSATSAPRSTAPPPTRAARPRGSSAASRSSRRSSRIWATTAARWRASPPPPRTSSPSR